MCIATAALLVWLIREASGIAFEDRPMPRPMTRPRGEPPVVAPSSDRSRPPQLPPEGAPFISHTGRRPGSLVSRVRRRHEEVEEPGTNRPAAELHVEEAVTVISRTRRRETAPEPQAPTPVSVGEAPMGTHGAAPRDMGMASAARKVGSLAREAILGYPFPAPETGPTTPHAGEEPAPGQTVVLVGDDVEAWVRERLYGGHLPSR